MTNLFLKKLRHGADLTADDERLLTASVGTAQRLNSHQDINVEGDRPLALTLIIDGWACRYRDLPDGRRMIIALLLPGDLCEPFGVLPRRMDHSLGALTRLTYAQVAASTLRAAAYQSARIEHALWWDALVSSAMMNERSVSLGVRSAVERVAHLFCELHFRLNMIGHVSDGRFGIPITQTDVANATGMTPVHVNRSLQALRATGLISLRERQLVIHDLSGLEDLALFDPGYLHLKGTLMG